jgi:hypothetical protein
MEDASGMDLDWFWRGWFYTTDYVDVALNNVKIYRIDSKNPDKEMAAKKAEDATKPRNISSIRNEKGIAQTQDEKDKNLRDYYTDDSPYMVDVLAKEEYDKYVAGLSKEEKVLLESGFNFVECTFEMKGELLTPILVQLEFVDGTKELHKIPAEIWRMGDKKVTKVFKTNKEVKQVVVDPFLETADVETSNNYFPNKSTMSRFEIFKQRQGGGENPMQRQKRAKEKEGKSGN